MQISSTALEWHKCLAQKHCIHHKQQTATPIWFRLFTITRSQLIFAPRGLELWKHWFACQSRPWPPTRYTSSPDRKVERKPNSWHCQCKHSRLCNCIGPCSQKQCRLRNNQFKIWDLKHYWGSKFVTPHVPYLPKHGKLHPIYHSKTKHLLSLQLHVQCYQLSPSQTTWKYRQRLHHPWRWK